MAVELWRAEFLRIGVVMEAVMLPENSHQSQGNDYINLKIRDLISFGGICMVSIETFVAC